MVILMKIGGALDKFAKAVAFICLCAMAIIMICEVVARNLFMSITWSEEIVATFLGSWFVFVGATVPLRAGQMVSMSFVLDRLPRRAAHGVIVLGDVLILVFLGVVVKFGITLSAMTMSQPSPALMFPMGFAYMSIPVGCAIMFYHVFVHVIIVSRALLSGDAYLESSA